jgi:hypothetical protein
MNTNRYLLPPHLRRRRMSREWGKLYWACATVFSGLLLAVIYCLVTHQLPT